VNRLALYRAGLPLGEGATRRRLGGGYVCGLGGGGGNSSADQTQRTENADMRVVGGDASTNISAQDSTVRVNVTDAGSVRAAFGFANDIAKDAFNFAISNQHDVADIVEKSEAAVSDAYSTAKAGEQKVLVGAALAIVGVVAFAAVNK